MLKGQLFLNMNILQAIFLGILQGLTEFLPVSSSGHLVIFQNIFGLQEPAITFDVLVHFGTLIALLIFFRKDIKDIFQNLEKEIKERKRGEYLNLFFSLIIGTIPIIIWGILLKRIIDLLFDSLLLVGVSFLFTAAILFLTLLFKELKKDFKDIDFLDAIIIGIFQAFSILPGLSRSGTTVSASLFQGLKRETAFKFSFFLGIIAILGATLLQIPEFLHFNTQEIINGLVGFLFSAIIGFFALRLLQKIILQKKLHYFGFYCAILGIICILIYFL